MKKQMRAGFSIVETLIAAAILSFIVVSFVGVSSSLTLSQQKSRQKLAASQYAREGLEFAYSMGQNRWADLQAYVDPNIEYEIIGSIADVAPLRNTGPEIIDSKYSRSLVLEFAKRDPTTGELSDTGTEDSGTIKVTSSVTVIGVEIIEPIEMTTYIVEL